MAIAVYFHPLDHHHMITNVSLQAIGQLCSTSSMAHNLSQCKVLFQKAAALGAKVCRVSIEHKQPRRVFHRELLISDFKPAKRSPGIIST